MTKWDYITEISRRGSRYGENGGVLDLLCVCGKRSTREITEKEAREFFETRRYTPALQYKE